MATRGRPRTFDREEALRRAMEVFWDKGYDGASMADLTQAMGINSPSLYAAFGSKAALFEEAATLYDSTEGLATDRALKEEPTARASIRALLRNTAEVFAAKGKPRGCLVILSSSQGAARQDGVDASLRARREQLRDALCARLRRGIKEGDVPAGTDVPSVASFYLTVLEGLSIQSRDGASKKVLLGIADSAMAAWDALTASEPRAR